MGDRPWSKYSKGSSAYEKKVSKKLLVSISASKNNTLLAVLHHSLPTRIFARVKKAEDKVQKRYNQIVLKRERLIQRSNELSVKELSLA